MHRAAETAQCRHQLIAKYFGESIQRCADACDHCMSTRFREELKKRKPPRAAKGARGAAPSTSGVTNAAPKTSAPKSSDEGLVFQDLEDVRLYERLKELRKSISGELNIPAYLVFNDGTLREMAIRRPTTEQALLNISGVGQRKLARFGRLFLAELKKR
jgi:ATP-dependent DNA helicase RecQ